MTEGHLETTMRMGEKTTIAEGDKIMKMIKDLQNKAKNFDM